MVSRYQHGRVRGLTTITDIIPESAYQERFPRNNCRQNARWMTLMHPELTQVEGYLVLTDHDGQEYRTEHTWNETPDGQLVDSTAWAFEDQALPYRYEPDPQAWPRAAVLIADLLVVDTGGSGRP